MPLNTSAQELNKPLILGALIIASMAAVMSTDMYAPSLATLPEILGTSVSMVQLTMGINALFFGLAQLIHGPLADRFGRRPVLLCGVGLFIVFSIMCGMADTIEELVVARALQGAAASVEAVLLLVIIGDIYEPKDRPKAFALYGAVWSVAPALAPVLGGHVHELWGWQWNFFIVAAVGLLAYVLAWFYLPETGEPDKHALRPRLIASSYLSLLRDRKFLGLSLLMSLPLAGILVYVTAIPFIFQSQFGFSVVQVGYYQAALVVAYMVASALTGKFAATVSHERLLLAGVLGAVLGLLLTVIIIYSGSASSLAILLAMLVFSMGFGPLFSVAPGMIMESAPTGSGAAAAMLGALEMAIVGLCITLLSIFGDGDAKAMANTFLVIAVCVVLVACLRPWRTSPEASDLAE